MLALAFDVCNREATRDAVASITDAFKPIDVLTTTPDWHAVWSPNTRATSRTGTR